MTLYTINPEESGTQRLRVPEAYLCTMCEERLRRFNDEVLGTLDDCCAPCAQRLAEEAEADSLEKAFVEDCELLAGVRSAHDELARHEAIGRLLGFIAETGVQGQELARAAAAQLGLDCP